MKGAQSRADAAQKRLSRQRRYLTLVIWVVSICLSFGLYTLLVNALLHDGPGEAYAPSRSFVAPNAQQAVVKIDPASKGVDPGETFTVTVMIEDASDLGAFEFELTYDSTCVVTATDATLGPFLGSTGRSVGEVGPTFGIGSVTYAAYSYGADPGPDGAGVLATITFEAGMTKCSSALHLQNVTVTDTDGNSSSPNTEDGEVIVGPPEVTSISPDWGYIGKVLENVIVMGENFRPGASVQLTRSGQSISAPLPDVQSSTRISCTLNLGKAVPGQWDVVVTNPDTQSGTLPNGFTINLPPPPAITSITPNNGYNDEVVHITNLAGSNFQTTGTTTVTLTKAGETDIVATSVVVESASKITCDFDLTGAAIGPWNVVVTNPDTQSETLTNGFTVKHPPPVVDSITPNSGRKDDVVHITDLAGSNFQTGATVKLTKAGETDIVATDVVVESTSKITCDFDLTGATVGQWDVVVTNPDTQSGTLTNGFTVKHPPPVVDSITPNNGHKDDVVHITDLAGSNFQTTGTTTVTLTKAGETDIVATHVVVKSASKITCDFDLTGAAIGPWNVVVTNPDSQFGDLPEAFIVKGLIYLPIVLENY